MIQVHRPRLRHNFFLHSSLSCLSETPLPHFPRLFSEACGCPASNSAGYSPRHPVRNTGSYLDDHPASYGAGFLPENLASSREDCLDSDSADHSTDCPDNHPAGNSEGNLPSNWASDLPDYSESSSVDSLPDYLESNLPGFRRQSPSPRTLEPKNYPTGVAMDKAERGEEDRRWTREPI